MADLSDAITPAMVVEKMQERGIHLSERTLREFVRKVGACRIIGKAMFFMPEDIEVLIAAAKPQPKGATSSSKPSWTESDTEKLLDRLEKGKKKR
ncbi:hypothetical protein [Agrobacterium tumefaciens]|uniref:hypothetical protein n=1 Tax=Agrobacterium tumefaciens TaxID=358 RepID=UPI0013CF0535|nr:hypothetical protein [Agrobacterium tumefaciens]NSZ33058.1 hypothetical protein [Agrobacterium tumefaciens]QLG22638.1 hypothetical protein EML4_10010 [Agrobacterium tumefaciens]UXS86521.1 hypothetical protein FY144_09970 [Agrobacterium tumefaciens]